MAQPSDHRRVTIPPWQVEQIKNDVLEFAAQLCEVKERVNGCAGRDGGDFPRTAEQCAAAIRARKTPPFQFGESNG
jgi:hypothetical protein